jgi:hypothetical protein
MRALVALLLLANLGWWALAQGWLQPYVGLSSQHEREPQRLAAQMAADSVRVLAVGAAAPAPAPDCLQAGPFSTAQIDALETALNSATSWQRLPVESGTPGSAAPATTPQWLRVEQPDAALRQRLESLAMATPGGSVRACAPQR